jgi:hypothetical protein
VEEAEPPLVRGGLFRGVDGRRAEEEGGGAGLGGGGGTWLGDATAAAAV